MPSVRSPPQTICALRAIVLVGSTVLSFADCLESTNASSSGEPGTPLNDCRRRCERHVESHRTVAPAAISVDDHEIGPGVQGNRQITERATYPALAQGV